MAPKFTLFSFFVLLVFVSVICALALKYVSGPFILISLLWLFCFLCLFRFSDSKATKSVWSNLAFITVIFAVLETYSFISRTEITREYLDKNNEPEEYFARHEILGYGPAGPMKVKSIKTYDNHAVYTATYTIGQNGLRITPAPGASQTNNCILFFGGSFTFGEGVNDEQSIPYIVGTLQGIKTVNYGFHGYGPHQMLAAIENALVRCTPDHVIYQAIVEHVGRSAGYAHWDMHGPKYVLRNGSLKYAGHFDDVDNGFVFRKFNNQLRKSHLYTKLDWMRYRDAITENDIQLFLAIVNESRRKLMSMHPHLKFHVLLWDDNPDDPDLVKIKQGLEEISMNVHYISGILPGYRQNNKQYELNKYDSHPNARAYRIIAEYVVDKIIATD